MRRLLRMTLEGFKTFAGRTDLEFGPGMTAIVGPNGSGKSNLIDALAWAVGSRSWKSLRGDGMEDVIFHGADGRPAAPLARVTLSLDNEDRLLGIDFSEVTITREIVRGAGSRVLVNGAEARLKDVQALLSGTGLVGGFSLIRQGVVDKLVLSAPEDVGRWIEESANIAGFRLRKQEAVERLRKMEANAAEAERRGASLRRELGQVRNRAERARVRRDLEELSRRLAEALRSFERSRLLEALQAVDSESAAIRIELSAGAASRRDLLAARRRVEEELAAMGGPARPPEGESEAGLPERVIRIRVTGNVLRSVAETLAASGDPGWAAAQERLDRAAAALQQISHGRATPDRSSRCAAGLSDLRRCSVELEQREQDCAALAAELSGRECERARLEERLTSMGEASADAAPPPDGLDPTAARSELEDLKRKLQSVGPVDETAEHREQEILRELEELAPVLEDLEAAREQLGAFIRQMEQHTSTLFDHTLARVDARFRNYFRVLFEGGDARLEVLPASGGDEGDPLRSAPPAVDVRVRLPRKPESSLALLSGGERSLAGLALVLALAEGDREEGKDPGRLLILDEVDAALDEANACRLALLLRDLQRRQQILCVSHNRLTMVQASRLVGVTSGGGTVSTLVKVALDRPAAGESAA